MIPTLSRLSRLRFGHEFVAVRLSAEGSSVKQISGLLPLLLIATAFYFLAIRPTRTRARAAEQMQSALRPGQEVVTTAGLYATVVELGDDTVLLEVAPGVHSRYAKRAIARVATGEVPGGPVPPPGGGPGTDEET